MEKLVSFFTTPLIIMNSLAGIVSAIWLIILGEWSIPLVGILITVVFPFVYGLTTLPVSLLFSWFSSLAESKGSNKGEAVFGLLHTVLSDILHFIWIIAVFTFLLMGVETQSLPLLPLLLAGYAISTGGLTYMASKEQWNEFTLASTFVVQVVSFLTVIYLFTGFGFLILPTMLIAVVVHTHSVSKMLRR